MSFHEISRSANDYFFFSSSSSLRSETRGLFRVKIFVSFIFFDIRPIINNAFSFFFFVNKISKIVCARFIHPVMHKPGVTHLTYRSLKKDESNLKHADEKRSEIRIYR